MKVCTTCKVNKSRSDFYTNGKTPKGTQKLKGSCKQCEVSNIAKRYYSIVERHFGGFTCQCCGYSKDKRMMEYHHIDSTTKDSDPSKMKTLSESRIIAELDKCVQLCPNCHREVHLGIRGL